MAIKLPPKEIMAVFVSQKFLPLVREGFFQHVLTLIFLQFKITLMPKWHI